MGYIFARLIHKGIKKIEDVPAKYLEATKAAYFDLYGENI